MHRIVDFTIQLESFLNESKVISNPFSLVLTFIERKKYFLFVTFKTFIASASV